VTVDGEGPDEWWSVFRAGRRAQVEASPPRAESGADLLRGRLRAFQGWTHERAIAFRPGRALVVLDEVRAHGRIEARIPLAPGFSLQGPLELRVLRGTLAGTEPGWRAETFDRRVPREVVVLRADDQGRIAFAFCTRDARLEMRDRSLSVDGAELAP
jgi:hypothetical protein